MPLDNKRWHTISPSQFQHEQDALNFLREACDPSWTLGVWTNFEFLDPQGKLYEVDAMVLSTYGVWLVEIKSYPGQVNARELNFIRRFPQGPAFSEDSPLRGINHKCKVLVSRLKKTGTFASAYLPYIKPLVFLSHPDVELAIDAPGVKLAVVTRKDLVSWLSSPAPGGGSLLTSKDESRLIQGLRELNIEGSRQRQLKVGSYILAELLGEGPDYQDHRATHQSMATMEARVRTYTSTYDQGHRSQARRLAEREYRLLRDLRHDAVLCPNELHEYELGTALVYDFYKEAERLDHYLVSRSAALSFLDRLRIWAQIGEALRYAHQRQLLHRSLAPQNVLILPGSDYPRVKVFNWHTARGLEASTGTVHLQDVVASEVTAYIAPEVQDYPEQTDVRADLFSLGCLGYYLFGEQAPGADYNSMIDRLLEQDCFDLRAICDTAPKELVDLICDLTRIEVKDRLGSAEEFLKRLAEVERQAASPVAQGEVSINPFEALPGDMLIPGWLLEQRLGQGATAAAFLVHSEEESERRVLKVALTPSKNELLEQEGEILKKLKHPQIVELHQATTVGSRAALLLTWAGNETLAQRLARDGAFPLELLQRLGDDLLGLVEVLEDQGVYHRDLKPANLGIRPLGKNEQLRLMMFDFSLSRTPPQEINAGTPGYRDPFLGSQRPFDTSAERYSAAVTLHEMGTCMLPQWGDGLTSPRLAKEAALTLAVERFDPALRERFTQFLAQALHRDLTKRFANAHDMRLDWNQIFSGVAGQPEQSLILLDHAEPETPLVQLTQDPRLLEVFERLQVTNAGQLLALPLKKPGLVPGLGGQTRRQLMDFAALLETRFEGSLPPPPPIPGQGLEGLLADFVPSTQPQRQLVESYLGLHSEGRWLPVSEALKRSKLEARHLQVIVKQRQRWQAADDLKQPADLLAEAVSGLGGIATTDEAADLLLRTKGSLSNDIQTRKSLARALLRVLIDREDQSTVPRFELRQVNGQEILVDDPGLTDALTELAREADEAVSQRPLPAQSRILADLKAKAPARPENAWSEARLLRVVTAVASKARLSARNELYPKDMEPELSLRWARGLLNGPNLTIQELEERVRLRYPEAASLPTKPETLQKLFDQADIALTWSDTTHSFRPPPSVVSSTHGTTSSAAHGDGRSLAVVARLDEACRRGEPQVLMTRRPHWAQTLTWLQERFDMEAVSLEAALLDELRQVCQQKKVRWEMVVQADAHGPDGEHWGRVRLLVNQAVDKLLQRLQKGEKPLLLQRFGLLARFERLDALERLLERSGRPDGRPAVWLLAPYRDGLPMIDGRPLPLPPATEPLVVGGAVVQSI